MISRDRYIEIPTFGMGIKCSTVGNLFLLALLMAEMTLMILNDPYLHSDLEYI